MGAFIDNEVTDYPAIVLPYSHAAGYEACPRTELVACSDRRPDMMAAVGERYNVPPTKQYEDYKELIDKEEPDILSVATQPEDRAEIVVYAAEHGVKAIYAEKAFAASLSDAHAMVSAVEKHRVAFNLGTNSRWNPGYDRMKEIIGTGVIGPLKSFIIYASGPLFNIASHTFDLALWINNDARASWVQAHIPGDEEFLDGDIIRRDPPAHAIIQFENNATVYALLTSRGTEFEAICETGSVASLNNGMDWHMRRNVPVGERKRQRLVEEPFPRFERASSTLRLIQDLVHALDTGEPTRGGVRVALAGAELIFACIESHRSGGARIKLPLENCMLRLDTRPAPRRATLGPS